MELVIMGIVIILAIAITGVMVVKALLRKLSRKPKAESKPRSDAELWVEMIALTSDDPELQARVVKLLDQRLSRQQ